MEKSLKEKKVLMRFVNESEKLPYPLKTVNGEEIYDIPEDKKAEVLQQLWPFTPVPTPDELLYDLHEDVWVKFKECEVLRYSDRNLVVSKYYSKSGGTAIDLIKDNTGVLVTVFPVK